jgi:hypothetical protein
MSTEFEFDDARILELLHKHPQLRARMEGMLEWVEDAGDELRNADEAEDRVIEEVRQLGAELLEGWAEGQVAKRAQELEQTPGVWREGKKN